MPDYPILAVEHLTKQFGSVLAVNDVSFTAASGEMLGLLGPNGAGKTTTIHLLLGLTTPTAGVARAFGLDVQRHRRAVLQRVNFSSAYISLPSNLSVWENLHVFARLYGLHRPRKKIEALLELFELPHIAHQITGGLSSGQLSRVNLCKALLNDPEILFLDEPTASLDPAIAAKVRETLRQLQQERGVTIVYTSHNMSEIERMCDRVIFLLQGVIVAEGTPQAVLTQTHATSLEELFIHLAAKSATPQRVETKG